jgi:gas vesicle protein
MNNDRIYYSHDSEVQAQRFQAMLTFLFLLFGLGIGAALALLFAPKSGEQVREALAKNVKDGLQSGRENIEPVVKRIEKEFAELQKNVEEHLPQS